MLWTYARIVPLVMLIFVAACTTFTPPTKSQISAVDAPDFIETQSVRVEASDIKVINAYAENKFSGEYGEYFSHVPYEVVEEYANKRFEATKAGKPLYLVIERASLIQDLQVNDSGYGGNQNDDVYSVEIIMHVLSGGTVEQPEAKQTIKMVKRLRQRRDILTRQQKIDGQINFLSNLMAEFDLRALPVIQEISK